MFEEIYSMGTARSEMMHIFHEKRYRQFTEVNCLPEVFHSLASEAQFVIGTVMMIKQVEHCHL